MLFLCQIITSASLAIIIWRRGRQFDEYVRFQVNLLRQSIAVKPDPLLGCIGWIQSIQASLRSGSDIAGALERNPLPRNSKHSDALNVLFQTGLEQGMPVGEALASLKRSFSMQVRGRRKAMALSTQARLQGLIAALLPPMVALAVFLIDPQFFLSAENRLGALTLLSIAILLEVAGALWMQRMVRNCFRAKDALAAEIEEFLAPFLSFVIGRLAMGLDVERSFQESIRSLPRARKLAKALSTFEPQSAPAPLDQIIAAKWRALELGAPIRSALGEILEDYENARESRYEELAQALPIKLLLPLFCCIFPANLAILMIPAIPAFQGF